MEIPSNSALSALRRVHDWSTVKPLCYNAAMIPITPKDIVLAQIHHQETEHIPYSIGFEGDVAERLDVHYGSSDWRATCNPYIATADAVNTDRKYPTDRPKYVTDPYGSLWFTGRLPWHLEKPALADADSLEDGLESYVMPKPEEFFLSPGQKRDHGFRVCEENPEKFLVGGCGWGLFERSWTIRGFENALMDMVAEPDAYAELLDRLTDLYVGLIRETATLPVDGILFGDDWGEQRGVIMGPERWRTFFKPRWARLFAETHACGKIAMCHSCGSVADIIPDLAEIGLDVLESCQPEAAGMDPLRLKRLYGDRITFWGTIGTQRLIPFGTPDEIRAEVAHLAREMGRGGGILLAPAKPLQPETPTENAVAVLEALKAL